VTTELAFHFLRFAIESESLDLGPWVERLYLSNDLSGRFPAQQRRLRIVLERKDSQYAAPIPPPRHGAYAETHLGLGPCYYEDGRFYSENRGHLWHEMEYDLDAHILRANLAGRYADSGQWAITYVLRPVLKGFLMPLYGLTTTHAAGLCHGDRTILLVGGPGAGKSTTAIHLMFAGYDLLSDDRTFIALDGAAARALSSLDGLHVSDATLRMFPALQPHLVGERDEGGKWAVSPAQLVRGTAWREPHRITDFIQLRRGPVARPRRVPVDRGGVLEHLLRETMVVFRARAFHDAPYPFRQYSDFLLAAAAAVIRDAQVYALEFADCDLPRIPALIEPDSPG
jgi:hypothetical protein